MAIPVSRVRGIGPKTVEYLASKKITTVDALLKSGETVLAEAPGFGAARAEQAMAAARELVGSSASADVSVPAESKKSADDKKKQKKDKKKKEPKEKKDKKKDSKKDKKKDKKDKKKNKKKKKS